jgi:hypothetical protein
MYMCDAMHTHDTVYVLKIRTRKEEEKKTKEKKNYVLNTQTDHE